MKNAPEQTKLQVVVTCHQNLATTHEDLGRIVEECYAPLISAIEKSDVRLSLHFSGHVLDYLSKFREDFLLQLKSLVRQNKIEILGGLYYGGLVALLPEQDVRGQIQMSTEYWESLLGAAPSGFWLSELSWCHELPRVFEDSDMRYGFVGAEQVSAEPNASKIVFERGGASTSAFVLDDVLSRQLPATDGEKWAEMATERGKLWDGRLLSTWLRAESLAMTPEHRQFFFNEGKFAAWLQALASPAHLVTVLPSQTHALAEVRPFSASLKFPCAPQLAPLAKNQEICDWSTFPTTLWEVDNLHRRMLRVSEKLRMAIETMEEESQEDEWGGALATAQRLIFSAQTHDAFWRGADAGFSEPKIRDATNERIVQAETMIDGLVQEGDDWISLEEEDLDADGREELFVANAHLGAWVVPAERGLLRSLDARSSSRNVLDVGCRREEIFLTAARQAPTQYPGGVQHWGQFRIRDAELVSETDVRIYRGVEEFFVEEGTTPEEFFKNSQAVVQKERCSWELSESGIDEDGDATFRCRLDIHQPLQGNGERHVSFKKTIAVPVDAAEISVEYQDVKFAERPGALALVIPARLGVRHENFTVNGEAADLVAQLHEVTSLSLRGSEGLGLELQFDRAIEVWTQPIRTVQRALTRYQYVDQGVLFVAIVPFSDVDSFTARLRLQQPTND